MSDDPRFPIDPNDDAFDFPAPATDRSRPEAEDLAERYGRHLFALAYHLCGDAEEAAALGRRVIAGHGLGPDAADTDLAAISIDLYRGLLGCWRSGHDERRRRRAAAPPGPAGGRKAGGQPAGRPLHSALDALDTDARVVTVLRIAEGLDYEEISVLLRLPAQHVRGALITGRRLLQAAMHGRSIDRRFETAMTLYLDGRLPTTDLAEFESHISEDTTLRRAVEFHRGLTLEFHEEVPPLPGDFILRVRQERERLAAEHRESSRPDAGARETAVAGRYVAHVGVALLAVAALAASIWRARTGTTPAGPDPAVVEAGGAGTTKEGARPDDETAEALRSLGYIAGGGSAGSEKEPDRRTAATAEPTPRPRPKAADQQTEIAAPQPESAAAPAEAAIRQPESAVEGSGPPPEKVATPPEPAAAAPFDQAAPPADPPPAAAVIRFRTIALERAPEIGRDLLVIRNGAEWTAFAGEAPAPADFSAEIVIVVRDALGDRPPTRLIVDEVREVDGALEIVARVAEAPPGGAPSQGIVVPATDRAVRLAIR